MSRLLCVNVNFMTLIRNCYFRGKRYSRNRRVHIRRVGCHWNHRAPLRVSVECVEFTLCECGFHDFAQKLLFSPGEVFSEQASPYQTSVVLLESLNFFEVPFKGLS